MAGESIARGTLLGEVDVVIGGTKPAGLTMANLFGRAGVNVAVLECEQGIRGDLFDADPPPGYHLMDRDGLYQWWPDLTDPRLTPCRLWSVLKMAVNDKARLKRMLALKDSLSRPIRQWRH